MDSKITREQVISISEKLELRDVSLLSELIVNKMKQRKEDLLVRIIFTSPRSLSSFIEEQFGINVFISSTNVCNFTLEYGTDEKNLLAYDSSMIRVEDETLNAYLSSSINITL